MREVMDMCIAAAPGCWSGAHLHLACGLLVQVNAPLLSGRRWWVARLAQVLIVLPLSHWHACRLQAGKVYDGCGSALQGLLAVGCIL